MYVHGSSRTPGLSCVSLEGVWGGSVSNAPPEPAFPQLPFRFIQ